MRVLTSVTIVIVAIFAVVAIRKAWSDRFGNNPQPEAAQVGANAEEEGRPGATDDRTLDWRFVGGAFVVALVGSAYAARLLLRNAHEPDPVDDTAEAVAAIIDDTLEDLRNEPTRAAPSWPPTRAWSACWPSTGCREIVRRRPRSTSSARSRSCSASASSASPADAGCSSGRVSATIRSSPA